MPTYKGTQKFKYEDTEFSGFECVITIDFDNDVIDQDLDLMGRIKDMVEFWGNCKNQLKRADGDYVAVFVRQLAYKIGHMSLEHSNVQKAIQDEEGYGEWVRKENGITFTYLDWEPAMELQYQGPERENQKAF